jgi:molybdopterin molybdotransferase
MAALLPVEDAQARLLALAAPLGSETLPLADAAGRALAAPLAALRSQPAAALSAMDGYAIRFADMPGPWRVTDTVAAGQWPQRPLNPGEAARIFTGAPLPDGADTVLLQEDVAANDSALSLTGGGPDLMGHHVRRAGSDFEEGAHLLPAGAPLTAGALGLAAMAGHGVLTVGRIPRLAITTTGDELVPPGLAPKPGQIPNSNAVMLAALLRCDPVVIGTIGHVADDRTATEAAIAAAATDHDVIVTTGGASVGAHDHLHAALSSLGAPPDFWKVAMRPGKPVMAARIGDAVLLGLPGNPASAFVTAQLFLRPLLRHLAGWARPLAPVAYAPLTGALGPGGARRDYLRAVHDGRSITPLGDQDSGLLTPLAAANALLIREAGAPAQAQGTPIAYIAV